ncbi:Uncharacterised protein [Raoultella ornithinolytica]|nr:Uncharacterised protein [Raoultella ornithinolytica]
MHKQSMLATDFYRHLTDSFEERQGFDITDGTADFNQHHIVTFTTGKHALFNRVSDVRDNLYGCAQIVTAALFTQNVGVNTTRGEVVAAAHFGTDEALVVTQVQIGFSAVFSNEHFPVLDWAHGARIDVDVRIQFHHGYVKPTGFENSGQGGCGNAFTQRGYDPAGHKNIVRCHAEPEKLG